MKQYIVNLLLRVLPISRLFTLKAAIIRFMGVEVSYGTKIQRITILGKNKISIGRNTFIGCHTLITGGKARVQIGNDCDVSNRVIIATGTHEIDPIGNHIAGKGYSLDIIIEDGVWIGIGAIILPGVVIGKKTVIGSGSVVNKSIPAYSIAAGNPCKVIKRWDHITKEYILVKGDKF